MKQTAPWIVTLSILCTAALPAAAASGPSSMPNVDLKNCAPERSEDEVLYQSDFPNWGYPLEEIASVYQKAYSSKKRLKNRAYYNPKAKTLILPWYQDQGGDVTLPTPFVKNVAGHIESALQKKVIDAVFFPDMGHSHFFVPQAKYDREYAKLGPLGDFFRKFLSDKEMKVLYHTAEKIKLVGEDKKPLPNERVQYRYKTRNLVGKNDGTKEIEFLQNPESVANTAGQMPGYHYWGSGFNLSANRQGCFYFVQAGQKVYFDISLYDLETDPKKVSHE
ncbi:MAG: hypothetical protein EOO48_13480 [Flavobacterium sp.]|nr:MAG: hypothetical protein EOO48_13480 [Flavobacterium sp.]